MAIEESFKGINQKTYWPLNAGQISAYFDIDEALDLYHRIKELKKTKSLKEISELMPPPDMMRYAILNNIVLGLKIANKLEIEKIPKEEREEYLLDLFEILEYKTFSDIFCLDGKNYIIDKDEVKKILNEINWSTSLSEEEKKNLALLIVNANNLCYTLFFDIFQAGGFYVHGPYNASERFGEGTTLIIRDYHNLNPKEIWPELGMPFQTIKILGIYKNLNSKINLVNHIITNTSIPDKLIAYKVFIDGKKIFPENIEGLIETLINHTLTQSKKVNSLSNLDKVRQGSKIAFSFFKKLRESMGDKWIPKNQIEETIEKFGEEFIKKFDLKETPEVEHIKRILDPRDDYY